MTEPKFPDVYVQLVGQDGGTGAILARVTRAMADYRDSLDDEDKKAEVNQGVKELRLALFDCDYDGFIRLVMETVSVGSPEDYE
jgi:hypothetical protein